MHMAGKSQQPCNGRKEIGPVAVGEINENTERGIIITNQAQDAKFTLLHVDPPWSTILITTCNPAKHNGKSYDPSA